MLTKMTCLLMLLLHLSYAIQLKTKRLPFKCAYNSLGNIPPKQGYTFEVLRKHDKAVYDFPDFKVNMEPSCRRTHAFWKWIGNDVFRNSFKAMDCKLGYLKEFSQICKYSWKDAVSDYPTSYGTDIVFKCVVPKNHLLLGFWFQNVFPFKEWKTNPIERWQIFLGIHKYHSDSEAQAIVKKKRSEILEKIKETKLTSYDIALTTDTESLYTKGDLREDFNDYFHTSYVQNIKINDPKFIQYEGFLKVLPPGTEIVAGAIFNGTADVKQYCSGYKINQQTDRCTFTI